MTYSESIHEAIIKIANNLKCSLLDATIEFCSINNIDPEELVEQMDEITIERLKLSAIEEHAIQKKAIGYYPKELPLE